MTLQPAIPTRKPLCTRNLVIDLDVVLVVASLLKDRATKIVELSRQVWFWIEIDNRLADRIDFSLRNYIQRPTGLRTHLRSCLAIWLATDWIEYWNLRPREISSPLGQRWHTGNDIFRLVVADLLNISEKKRLILYDWPAN